MLTDGGEVWAVAPSHRALVEEYARAAWRPGVAPGVDMEPLDNGTALVHITGTLTKYGSGWLGVPGTTAYRSMLRALARDAQTKRIVMLFDSPGGSVAGVDDLAEEVRLAARKKPVIAYCEDLCASAAYWVASQAREVYANRSALVGSIGVYSIVYDDSQAAADAGVKVHLIKSAEFKGAGEPGVPVTDEQLADWQRIIDDTHSQFVAAVMRARPGVDSKSFDGRVHHAAQARKLGLIDGVKGLDEVLADSTGKANTSASASASATSITTYVAQAVQKVSATERVNALIAEGVGRGETRAHVIGALAQTHPELMRAWCDEKTAATHARKGRR